MPEEAAKKTGTEKAGAFAGKAMEAVTPGLPNFATYGAGTVASANSYCAERGYTLRVTTTPDTPLGSCPTASEEQMSWRVSANHQQTPPAGPPSYIDPNGTVGVIIYMPAGPSFSTGLALGLAVGAAVGLAAGYVMFG